MTTREEALAYGLSFDNVYEEKPFHDPNWQLVRVRGSKKAFLWIYERNGFINLNVKVAPEWRDFWRSAYDSVSSEQGTLEHDHSGRNDPRKGDPPDDRRKL